MKSEGYSFQALYAVHEFVPRHHFPWGEREEDINMWEPRYVSIGVTGSSYLMMDMVFLSVTRMCTEVDW